MIGGLASPVERRKIGGFWDDTRYYIAKTRRPLLLPKKESQIYSSCRLRRPWVPRIVRAAALIKTTSAGTCQAPNRNNLPSMSHARKHLPRRGTNSHLVAHNAINANRSAPTKNRRRGQIRGHVQPLSVVKIGFVLDNEGGIATRP